MQKASLPALREILVSGGDTRIALDPKTGRNKYGCVPVPDRDVLAYASSTASDVSVAGFDAAELLRTNLLLQMEKETPAEIYRREIGRLRQELLDLSGVANLKGVETVFAASGTDLHLLTAQLAAEAAGSSLLAIMPERGETGSGVYAALAGKHFSSTTSLGASVSENDAVGTANKVEVAVIAIRTPDGRPRPAIEIDAEVERLVETSIGVRRAVLLNLVDTSKTGMITPSLACAVALKKRYPDMIEVFVDGCQFRLAPSTIRAYLEHGFWLALTGSKFVTGPAFSGVLLVPGIAAARLKDSFLPQALSIYSAKADWPEDWAAARALKDVANFGLLFRWEAALQELRAFRALAEPAVTKFFETFGGRIKKYFDTHAVLEPLLVPTLQRAPCVTGPSWDSVQTIFPFLQRNKAGRLLRQDETVRLYSLLNNGGAGDEGHLSVRCQIGQPVNGGARDGYSVSALRLCLSARLATMALAPGGVGGAKVMEDALIVLEKATWLLDHNFD